MPQTTTASRFITATLAGLFSLTVCAQTARPPALADLPNAEAAWRAGSRLGYAPTPASLETMAARPRDWALQQVDAAYAASQQPPILAPELARINAPMADIARDFQAEREARKVLRVQPVADGASMTSPPVAAVGSPPVFSRDMAQATAAWRRPPPPGA